MRKNPAACSNDFGPMPLTLRSSLRDLYPPFGRASSTALARAAVKPATCWSNSAEAEFSSTPTWHTHPCTTCASSAESFLGVTSDWYMPTPRDTGLTLTSSASGSCSLRASDAAPRVPTSVPGSAAAAFSDTERTDAPASSTMVMRTWENKLLALASASATTSCVSREAVPLPIATTPTECREIHSRSVAIASARRNCGGWG
mmetsp:Transcript_14199/g.43553  ORF Transcript_14199/g.43553 Transcript_14199/m.43553 type:complete len:202 (+) Transcript_14199:969-1574(+)|eukprot:scaffold152027_cov28-Tisochrysis_lutea.AAC.2